MIYFDWVIFCYVISNRIAVDEMCWSICEMSQYIWWIENKTFQIWKLFLKCQTLTHQPKYLIKRIKSCLVGLELWIKT